MNYMASFTWSVRRNEVSGKSRSGSTRVETGPKSDAGLRSVALPRAVMAEIARHLTKYVGLAPDAPVFPSRRGDQPLRRADLSVARRAALKKVEGAPENLHIHDLRHFAATTMARLPGISTKELMSRIGHASPVAALRYQHATEERDRAIADFLDEQISAVQRPTKVPVVRSLG
jgi:integrase